LYHSRSCRCSNCRWRMASSIVYCAALRYRRCEKRKVEGWGASI
jgi:hypothetical protein